MKVKAAVVYENAEHPFTETRPLKIEEVDLDPPGIGPIDPRQDVHQRRLARAVLAQQGMHLAGGQGEIDRIQHAVIAKGLRRPADAQRRNRTGGVTRRWVRRWFPS